MKPKIKKAQYQQYRGRLLAQKVQSFIDQWDRTFTHCDECIKADCKIKAGVHGCMDGDTRKDIIKKIAR